MDHCVLGAIWMANLGAFKTQTLSASLSAMLDIIARRMRLATSSIMAAQQIILPRRVFRRSMSCIN